MEFKTSVRVRPVNTETLSSLALDTEVAPVLCTGRLLSPASHQAGDQSTLAVHLRELSRVTRDLLTKSENTNHWWTSKTKLLFTCLSRIQNPD